MKLDDQTYVKWLDLRIFTYNLFAWTLCVRPDAKHIENYRGDDQSAIGAARNFVGLKLDLDLSMLDLDELNSVYGQLFDSNVEDLVPLWASVYVGEKDVLFNAITLRCQHVYADINLKYRKAPHYPEDHLGVIFEYVSKWSEIHRESEKRRESEIHSELETDLEKQSAFFRDILVPTVMQVSEEILRHTNNAFYISFAEFMKCFVLKDALILSEGLSGFQKINEYTFKSFEQNYMPMNELIPMRKEESSTPHNMAVIKVSGINNCGGGRVA